MDVTTHPFFSDVAPEDLDRILERSQLRQIPGGSVVFDEGADSNALFLVLSGRVGFQKQVREAEWLTINECEPGGYFGEIGVLTGESRALRAKALEDVQVVEIPGTVLHGFLKNISGPVDKLFQSVIQHLHRTTRHYVDDRLHQEKMAMVGSMINSIVHDFKNPFCLISLSAQMLQQKYSDAESQRLCNNIVTQVDRMVNMAGELSEYSRGEQSLVKNSLYLDELLEEFRHNNFPYFEYDHIDVSIDVPHIRLQASRSKLMRVFQNLIGNAIEAMGDKAGEIKVRAKRNTKSKQVEITVRDNAGGIPESIRDRFFEPFVSYGKNDGTGLGTAICRSIVEAHGGHIEFETETDKGTVFHIYLPCS